MEDINTRDTETFGRLGIEKPRNIPVKQLYTEQEYKETVRNLTEEFESKINRLREENEELWEENYYLKGALKAVL